MGVKKNPPPPETPRIGEKKSTMGFQGGLKGLGPRKRNKGYWKKKKKGNNPPTQLMVLKKKLRWKFEAWFGKLGGFGKKKGPLKKQRSGKKI